MTCKICLNHRMETGICKDCKIKELETDLRVSEVAYKTWRHTAELCRDSLTEAKDIIKDQNNKLIIAKNELNNAGFPDNHITVARIIDTIEKTQKAKI